MEKKGDIVAQSSHLPEITSISETTSPRFVLPHLIPQTKTEVPACPTDYIARPELLDALQTALLSHRLTLVSGPAGYGKTTLLSSLPSKFPDLSLCWYTLNLSDDDPSLFLTGIITALQRLDPYCGSATLNLLTAAPPTMESVSLQRHFQQAAIYLVNEIAATLISPFVLVLDELELLQTKQSYFILETLIENLPPQMHIAMTTRHHPPLPLAKWQAKGILIEFQLNRLRFSDEESQKFLAQQGCAGFSPEEIATINRYVEGWPAGLRLLCTSLQHLPTASAQQTYLAMLANAEQKSDFATLAINPIFEFLAEDVLAHETEETRTFLLQTAILEELQPSICQAITGRSDAATLLKALFRRNLFITVIESTSQEGTPILAYRYNALFRQYLYNQLLLEMPDQFSDLHHRAAEAIPDEGQKIELYLTIEAWDKAAHYIQKIAPARIDQYVVTTLQTWLLKIPESARLTRQPRLIIAIAPL
ncbi:MAG: AAA family ATPase [Chloroflexota bacterium]